MSAVVRDTRNEWVNLARRTSARVNIAWALAHAGPAFLIASSAIMVWAVASRQFGLASSVTYYGSVTVIVSALVVSALRAKSRFITREDALELIDERLDLQNRLSAARQGAFEWPASITDADLGIRWKMTALSRDLCCGAAMIAAGFLIPVQSVGSGPAKNPSLPSMSVTAIENLTEELREKKLLSEQSIEKLEQKVEQLTNLPPEQWYEHSTLEAADSLRESTEQEIAKLQKQLSQAAANANELASAAKEKNEAQAQELQRELKQALNEMQNGELTPSEDLARALERAAKEQQMMIPPEQAQALEKQLRDAAQELGKSSQKGHGNSPSKEKGQGGGKEPSDGQCNGSSGSSADGGSCSKEDADGSPGDGSGDGEGNDKEGRPGGVSRGRGDAPLVLNQKPPQLTSDREENLPAKQVGTPKPGELAGLSAHAPDESEPHAIGQGGTTGNVGSGSDAVWKQNLKPEEARIVEKYFH